MENVYPWLSLGVGALAMGNSLLRAGFVCRIPRVSRPFIGAALLLVVLAAILTLPVKEPFSPGQTLGPGLLLGALAGLLGMVTLPPASSDRGETAFLTWSGRIGASVCGVSLLVIFYSSHILDALSGFALGALIVGLTIGGGLALVSGSESEDDEAARLLSSGAESAARVAVALGAATYLATFHLSPSGVREWQILPALFAAAGALLLAARSAIRVTGSWLYSVLLVPIPILVIAWLLAHQLHATDGFLKVVAVSLAGFGLVGWLDRGAVARSEAGVPQRRIDVALLTGLLVLGAAVIAFREQSGFGLAMMTLAGVVLVPVLFPDEQPGSPVGRLYHNALLVGLLLTLYRLHVERNEYLRGFQPEFLYYYVALILGALLPGLLSGLAEETMAVEGTEFPRRTFSALARMLLVGAVALLAPLAVWLLIGDRPESAMLVGLTVGAVLLGVREEPSSGARVPVWRTAALLLALSAVQFTHMLAPLALRTRGQRLGVLVAVAAVALIAVAVTAWQESRWRKQSGT